EQARLELRDILLFQRRLRPVDPGRCTFYPDEARAPLALPSVQRFRMYQEINNLRWLDDGLQMQELTLEQRDAMAQALESSPKKTFQQLRKITELSSGATFSVEDMKRQEFKGNTTSFILSKKQHFGAAWLTLEESVQDEIVMRLLTEENESVLINWLQEQTGIDEERAAAIASVALP